MFNKKLFIFILSLSLLCTFFSTTASSYQLGGDINTGINSLFYEEENIYNIYEKANIALNFDKANLEFSVSHNSLNSNQEENINFTLKKAYIKQDFKNIKATIGKQPISWSFGSLINPIDYSLGAEALDEETSVKFVNALKLDYPVNWYSSLSLVAEVNSRYDKFGLRGRTLIKDYDMSLNYVKEDGLTDEIDRWGISFKGDIKNLGVYGSYTNIAYKSLNTSRINTQAAMIGTDYSYFLNEGYGNRLYLQGEYHIIENNEGLFVLLSALPGNNQLITNQTDLFTTDKYFKILLSNISYNINDFSSIGFFTLSSLNDGSTAIIPNYRNQLSTNTTLNINLSYFSGGQSDIFSSGAGMPKAVLNVELSYAF